MLVAALRANDKTAPRRNNDLKCPEAMFSLTTGEKTGNKSFRLARKNSFRLP